MGSAPQPKKTQLEKKGEMAAANQRVRDMRREERRKQAVRTRQAGRLSLLGAPEADRQTQNPAAGVDYNPRKFVGGGPQPAAAGY